MTPSKPESGERFHPLKAFDETAGPPARHPRHWKRSLELQDAARGALGRNRWARQRFAETLHRRDKAVVGSVGSANSAQTVSTRLRGEKDSSGAYVNWPLTGSERMPYSEPFKRILSNSARVGSSLRRRRASGIWSRRNSRSARWSARCFRWEHPAPSAWVKPSNVLQHQWAIMFMARRISRYRMRVSLSACRRAALRSGSVPRRARVFVEGVAHDARINGYRVT